MTFFSNFKKKAKRVKRSENYRIPTQQERLEEAKITAQINTESLYYLIKMEEEKKQRAIRQKEDVGPKIKFYSRNGENVLIFSDSIIPPEICAKEQFIPKKPICIFTGKEARFKDPLTGI